MRVVSATLLGLAVVGLNAAADDLTKGTPELKSAGPLTFGPDGLLFVGDTEGAAIFAIDTGDRGPRNDSGSIKVDGINEKAASLLGTTAKEIMINDVAVNPASGRAYLSVSRGRGPDAAPVILRVEPSGKLEQVSLENVKFAKATLPNPPSHAPAKGFQSDPRTEVITDLAFVDGRVFVAGLSNEEFSSRLLAIPYPFAETKEGTSVEIFHGAHGRFETRSPVRTFVSYEIDGKPYLMAAYTCTPLVKFPVSELKPGSHVKGTTVAELGNRNKPLDMIVYEKGGKDYLLLANSSRGVMKITTDGIGQADSIVKPVRTERQGQTYETISALKGILQLDRFDKMHALVLIQTDSGAQNLETIDLP
jgi:hypothetical protein